MSAPVVEHPADPGDAAQSLDAATTEVDAASESSAVGADVIADVPSDSVALRALACMPPPMRGVVYGHGVLPMAFVNIGLHQPHPRAAEIEGARYVAAGGRYERASAAFERTHDGASARAFLGIPRLLLEPRPTVLAREFLAARRRVYEAITQALLDTRQLDALRAALTDAIAQDTELADELRATMARLPERCAP